MCAHNTSYVKEVALQKCTEFIIEVLKNFIATQKFPPFNAFSRDFLTQLKRKLLFSCEKNTKCLAKPQTTEANHGFSATA